MQTLKLPNNQYAQISPNNSVLTQCNVANCIATLCHINQANKRNALRIFACNNWHKGNYKTSQYFYNTRIK